MQAFDGILLSSAGLLGGVLYAMIRHRKMQERREREERERLAREHAEVLNKLRAERRRVSAALAQPSPVVRAGPWPFPSGPKPSGAVKDPAPSPTPTPAPTMAPTAPYDFPYPLPAASDLYSPSSRGHVSPDMVSGGGGDFGGGGASASWDSGSSDSSSTSSSDNL